MDFSTCDNLQQCDVPCIESLFANDPQLRSYEKDIRLRYGLFEKTLMAIEREEGFDRFSRSYENYGVVLTHDGGVKCREWIPNARAVYLKGDFSNWERVNYKEVGYGQWEIYIPPNHDGSCSIPHLSELKIEIETRDNQVLERISPWANYVTQWESLFKWLFWNPQSNEICKRFVANRLPKPDRLRIYEAHIGISSDRCQVSSFRHFTSEVLPRIRDLGYNCVLLMAIMEHPCYSSVGCQVTNFFAPSSRYGTPEDLRELISVAHEMGIYVMMDVMHSEASRNSSEGLNRFDGTDDCFFRSDRSDCHARASDTRKFDFTKWEVLRFLLSNLRHYVDNFDFDGFRFRDVTSMIYHDQSSDRRYASGYKQYFGMHMDIEAMAYLMLANKMLHQFYPQIITIAEEHSEYPGLTQLVREGGFGFDYRLSMHIPSKWMQLLNERRDEDWNMNDICEMFLECRRGEKYITFSENYEQNTDDQWTIARQLMGDECMLDGQEMSLKLDRGISLYKMVRLFTSAFSGQAFLNFMGNEFGHPDWVEFPSVQNFDNYHLARRQFQLLADNPQLRYKFLNNFDMEMNRLEERFAWLNSSPAFLTRQHNDDKVIIFERAGLLFMFNFHPTRSYPDYRIGVRTPGKYNIVLDSDDKMFGGHGRNQASTDFCTQQQACDNMKCSLMVYLPSRCVVVMANETIYSKQNWLNANRVYNEYGNCGERGRNFNDVRRGSEWHRHRSHSRGRQGFRQTSPGFEARFSGMCVTEPSYRRETSPYKGRNLNRSQNRSDYRDGSDYSSRMYRGENMSKQMKSDFGRSSRSPVRSRSIGFKKSVSPTRY